MLPNAIENTNKFPNFAFCAHENTNDFPIFAFKTQNTNKNPIFEIDDFASLKSLKNQAFQTPSKSSPNLSPKIYEQNSQIRIPNPSKSLQNPKNRSKIRTIFPNLKSKYEQKSQNERECHKLRTFFPSFKKSKF